MIKLTLSHTLSILLFISFQKILVNVLEKLKVNLPKNLYPYNSALIEYMLA